MSYKITEEQIKDIAQGGGKSKIKQMFPEVFYPDMKIGKWYRVINPGGLIENEVKEGMEKGDLFRVIETDLEKIIENDLFKKHSCSHLLYSKMALAIGLDGYVKLMSQKQGYTEEVSTCDVGFALAQEARKKGFVTGVKFQWGTEPPVKFGELGSDDIFFELENSAMYNAGGYIWKNDKWATIINLKTISKQEAEDRLKDLTGEQYKIN